MQQNFEISLLDKIKTPIINKFYDLNRVKGRANKQDDVWVVRHNSDIIAACRVQNISGHLFLCTLFVTDKMRQKGIAKSLIRHLISSYKNTEYRDITTFPYTHLTGLYLSTGFNLYQTLPEPLAIMLNNYLNQGRKISAMRYFLNN
ncbi:MULTISPECIES: GNAT family N-acetyltransferase [unclassified Pseudoalteromonas]|uniref:GNAT family N-acetyltransferase n=1 Tax=unclassified Pseudoalteromonas TaxID=194690 RepID=UPI0005AAD085|nr:MULTISPECIES: GNAT family N-acetyltransferase [unclassified Pseudoalteromonas]